MPVFKLNSNAETMPFARLALLRFPSPSELGLTGPFALSLALHGAVILFTTASWMVHKSQAPIGILVDRYGIPGAGAPAVSEIDIDYSLPSDVALPAKKKKLKKAVPLAKTKPEEGSEGSGRLGNATTGSASGVMGDPNGIVVSTRQRYLYELKTFFDQRKRYPAQARELGQTGEVAVAFELNNDGTIANVALTTPSRHERLNQAALTLVKTAGNFKPLPAELQNPGGTPWKLTVPIRYELN